MILDAAVLVAIDRREARAHAFLTAAVATRAELATSAGVVAQVWRNGARQALLARVLDHVEVHPLADGRRVGMLLARSGTTDPVDAHVVLLGSMLGRRVVTSDVSDLQRIADALPAAERPTIVGW